MPVTKTAKRALRSSKRKEEINKILRTKLETAIRIAKKDMKKGSITNAISLADRAAKRKIIHPNKAARIKSVLSKLASSPKKVTKDTRKKGR